MKIENISFIIIAKNEEFAVNKSLCALAEMDLTDCEVICVDSSSTDNTQDIMRTYYGKIENLQIIQISGYVNSAIARNTGMKYTTKAYIFYVDGDIELYPEFITEALKRIYSGKADAVTGKLLEIQYNPDYSKEIRRLVRRAHMTEEKKCLMGGGIFLASSKIVNKVGIWDSSFVRGQDLDFTLRLSRCGTLLQLPQFVGVHHTQEYHNRSWEHYLKGYPLLFGRLLRKSLNSPRLAIGVLRRNRGLLTFLLMGNVFLFCSVATTLSLLSWPMTGVIMAVCLLVDCVYSTILKHWQVDQWILHNYLTPPMILCGLFCSPIKHTEKTEEKIIIKNLHES